MLIPRVRPCEPCQQVLPGGRELPSPPPLAPRSRPGCGDCQGMPGSFGMLDEDVNLGDRGRTSAGSGRDVHARVTDRGYNHLKGSWFVGQFDDKVKRHDVFRLFQPAFSRVSRLRVVVTGRLTYVVHHRTSCRPYATYRTLPHELSRFANSVRSSSHAKTGSGNLGARPRPGELYRVGQRG